MVFLGVMLGASLLTLLRTVAVAYLLPASQFGTYAIVLATGAFLATLISFGASEATIKDFPRLIADGDQKQMVRNARSLVLKLALRAIGCAVPFLVLGWITEVVWLRLTGIAFLCAFAMAWTGVLASMQRAASSPKTLASGTLLRTGATFILVVIAATAGLELVLIAEIAGSCIACFISERLFFGQEQSAEHQGAPKSVNREKAVASKSNNDGLLIFLSFTLIGIPFYLDRLFIGATMGMEEAGKYGILAIFLTAASLLVNTIAQRVGPDVIRLTHQNSDSKAAFSQMYQWIGIASVFWLTFMAGVSSIFYMDWLPSAFKAYAIEPQYLVPITLSGVLLNTGLMEFMLLALNREKAFLHCSMIFVLAVVFVSGLISLLHWELAAFLWALVAARALYAACLLYNLHSPALSHKGSHNG